VLAIVNARVWTNDPRRPWADALLVEGAQILAVGSSAELRKRAGPHARVLDARGLLVRPAASETSLSSGTAASLVLVEGGAGNPADGTVVLEMIDGRITRDRDGVAE
jgi:hypothetical protein